MTKKKYTSWTKVDNIYQFINVLEKGGSFFLYHKYLGPEFVSNWTINSIKRYIGIGALHIAIPIACLSESIGVIKAIDAEVIHDSKTKEEKEKSKQAGG